MPIRTKFVPELGNCEASVKVIEVPDPPVPALSSNNAPFKVVFNAEVSSPPQDPRPQPAADASVAGPIG